MNIFAGKCFENPVEIIEAFDNTSYKKAFFKIEQYRKTHCILGYIKYEAYSQSDTGRPLLYFEVYENYNDFLVEEGDEQFVCPVKTLDFEQYKKDIEKIKEYISSGDTYEVNYTYDWKVVYPFDGFMLYKSLLSRQKTPYNAYMKNNYEEVLSFSPELFFEIKGGKILTKPMKGTICRGKDEDEDILNIEFLKKDEKNRAENVMIVDLLRNDLSKIAKTGTVKVPKLFEIETHPTLHQMTSEVTAELREDVTLYDIFEAIFPCGSITGAPKIRTMEIIDELEHGKRGIYCGAIGLITPDKITFSVPIRILQRTEGSDIFKYHTGGAVVWDSTPYEEWEETKVKASFLTSNYENLKIIETIKVENGIPWLLYDHLNRMKNTAAFFGFKFNENLMSLIPEQDGILKILLSKSGEYELQYKPINNLPFYTVKISPQRVNSNFPFLYHKTAFRPYYKNIDEIFFNERGELTENSIANVIIEQNKKMYTPPIECGLLNGFYRAKLLKEGKIIEKKLYFEDLKKADNIYCVNSVRGMWKVKLCL